MKETNIKLINTMKKETLKTITKNIAMVAVILGFSTMISQAQDVNIASGARTILNEQLRDYSKLKPADNDYFGLLDPRDAIVLNDKIVQHAKLLLDICDGRTSGNAHAEYAALQKLRAKFVKRYSDNYRQDPYYTLAHDDIATFSWDGMSSGFSTQGANARHFSQ